MNKNHYNSQSIPFISRVESHDGPCESNAQRRPRTIELGKVKRDLPDKEYRFYWVQRISHYNLIQTWAGN